MKKTITVLLFFGVSFLLTACGQTGPLMLPPAYIAKKTTKEVPLPPSRTINSNVNVIQSGI